MDYGIGFKDSNVITEIDEISVPLFPFESKIIKLVVFNIKPENDIVDITASVEEIVDITDVKVSTIDSSPSTWNRTTSLVQKRTEYPLYVQVTNKYYCESLVNIKLEYKQYKAPIKSMSYYGDLTKPQDDKEVYYLPREIEVKSKRTLVINPVPEGATYTYLSYSHGNHLILLDDRSAIKYTEEDIKGILEHD